MLVLQIDPFPSFDKNPGRVAANLGCFRFIMQGMYWITLIQLGIGVPVCIIALILMALRGDTEFILPGAAIFTAAFTFIGFLALLCFRLTVWSGKWEAHARNLAKTQAEEQDNFRPQDVDWI